MLKNTDCRYSLEPPRQGSSNEYGQSVLSRNMKNIRFFLSEKFPFLVVKFTIYLNRRVFVMHLMSCTCKVLMPLAAYLFDKNSSKQILKLYKAMLVIRKQDKSFDPENKKGLVQVLTSNVL